MKNAIILHGLPDKDEYYDSTLPSESNAHWLPWLQKQLLVREISAATPEVPRAFESNWAVWAHEVERFEIGPETILVGHSVGGGFFIKYLSIHPELRVGKVVLVAPSLDPHRQRTQRFFDGFTIDPRLVARTQGLSIFVSDNDRDYIAESAQIIQRTLPEATFRTFLGYGHFCYEDLHTTEFPELLQEIVGESGAA